MNAARMAPVGILGDPARGRVAFFLQRACERAVVTLPLTVQSQLSAASSRRRKRARRWLADARPMIPQCGLFRRCFSQRSLSVTLSLHQVEP
jgi:hypothetical protein